MSPVTPSVPTYASTYDAWKAASLVVRHTRDS